MFAMAIPSISLRTFGLTAVALLIVGNAWAQGVTIIQSNDGTSGTVFDLGGGIKTYSDSRGTTGMIQDLGGGIQIFNFHSPQGRSQSGTIFTSPSISGSPPGSSPSTPFAPLPPLTPLTPHQVVTPAPVPPPSFSTFGHR